MRATYSKGPVAGAGVKPQSINVEVVDKPALQDYPVSLVRIDKLCSNGFGGLFGFGSIVNNDTPFSEGQEVFLIHKVVARLREHGYNEGSMVALKLKPQDDEEKIEKTPWVGVFWEIDHTQNEQSSAPAIAETQVNNVLVKAREAMSAYVSLGDLARADREACKAAQDVINGAKDRNYDAISSAVGRLNARLQDLEVIRCRKDAMAVEMDSFLEEFADRV